MRHEPYFSATSFFCALDSPPFEAVDTYFNLVLTFWVKISWFEALRVAVLALIQPFSHIPEHLVDIADGREVHQTEGQNRLKVYESPTACTVFDEFSQQKHS